MIRGAAQPGRLVRITLRDVPIEVRQRAAWPLIDECSKVGDVRGAVMLSRAVESPSDVGYFVSEKARRRVLG